MRGIHALVFCGYLFIHLHFVRSCYWELRLIFFVVVARTKKAQELRKKISFLIKKMNPKQNNKNKNKTKTKTKQKQNKNKTKTKQNKTKQNKKTSKFWFKTFLEFKMNKQTQNELCNLMTLFESIYAMHAIRAVAALLLFKMNL